MPAESASSPLPDVPYASRVMRIVGSLSEPVIDVRLEDDSTVHLPTRSLHVRQPNGQIKPYRGQALRELGVRIGSSIEVMYRPNGSVMGILGSAVGKVESGGLIARMRKAINFGAS